MRVFLKYLEKLVCSRRVRREAEEAAMREEERQQAQKAYDDMVRQIDETMKRVEAKVKRPPADQPVTNGHSH